MEYYEYLLIVAVGFIAGFVNTVAGGGSLLSLPVLIFLGLPPAVANATNRVAIMGQNIFSVAGFQSKGVSARPYSWWLAGSSLIGGAIGAWFAVEIDADLFNRILAIIMVLVVLSIIFDSVFKKKSNGEKLDFMHQLWGVIAFFFIGIYGGFIQAGVGFLTIAALTHINGFSLVKANFVKVFAALIYTGSALLVFIIEDKVNWTLGLVLAVGNSAGGWIASRWSVEKGDKVIRIFLVITVIALAIKLWFFT
ncbi:MAG: sulfite exporter TauE/SafE family protein [Imperialibacter sp.]|jgi:uncharacterized protein|uniref:sulfite exporter TauE/SafE family protein n=1 Tax=Imperialibacter sp. TaxID=2038411 RepID=UPI0030D961AE|tara:strand:+ start:63457 stop:64209 length:753 start_codon:yes stop_codon:yes gene_type:complete